MLQCAGRSRDERRTVGAVTAVALASRFWGLGCPKIFHEVATHLRDAQDRFAAESQQKAEAAQKAGLFRDEIIPGEIPQRRGEPVRFDEDEFPRHGTTAEGLAKLRPAFDREGSVTAGNASGINDGAAAVLVMSERKAADLGLQPLARLKAFAATGVDPSIMGTGPISASNNCLAKAGWSTADLDLIDANEAFAAQAMSVNQEMGWDVGKVNVNGGAIHGKSTLRQNSHYVAWRYASFSKYRIPPGY
ncbi:MAG: hypothetical protein G8D28_10320, partial [gamma proteobacterium symbiont of Phacoides pectinatus]